MKPPDRPNDPRRPQDPNAYGHPYRSAATLAELTAPANVVESYEDRVVLSLIAIVGALGVAIGLLAPERNVEPSLGLLMLLFAAWTLVHEARRRRRDATRDER